MIEETRRLVGNLPRVGMLCASRGKKNKFGHFLVVVQLIHRLMQAEISCTTTTRLFFFLLLGYVSVLGNLTPCLERGIVLQGDLSG